MLPQQSRARRALRGSVYSLTTLRLAELMRASGYEVTDATVEQHLRTPWKAPPDIEALRAALEQRATEWKAKLRAEPRVARLLLRRLVGPLTLWEESEGGARWDAPIQAENLLDGLVQLVPSPPGFVPARDEPKVSCGVPEDRRHVIARRAMASPRGCHTC